MPRKSAEPSKQQKDQPRSGESSKNTEEWIEDQTEEYLGKSITITGGGARPNQK